MIVLWRLATSKRCGATLTAPALATHRIASSRAMAALDVLPREVLAKCLEFLAFDQVVEAKQVSKDVRSAARRALIVHWRPIKFVAERGYDLVRALRNSSVSATVTVDAAALATFRAAWELDPGLVVLEIAQYSQSREAAKFL